jgi:cell division protein FtsI/penicillin-binding protein 2
MSSRFVLRVRLLTAVLLLMSLAIVAKLYLLQVVHGQEYSRRASAQLVSTRNPLLNRGAIYFTDKDQSPILAATLREVGTTTDHQRYYPGGSLAARTLGFVAYNNDNEQKGRYGLERYYESVLGRSGDNLYRNFFVELFGAAQGALGGSSERGDLITSIEPSVQGELERTLDEYETTWHPKLSGGIVMDPQTGAIVAMALSPTFDLNAFNKEEDPTIYANPMAQNVYEMGSIMKPLTMAAGIDSGAVKESTTYNDTGCITVDTKKICNFDGEARGVIPMQEVLSQSLNLGASFVATQMGPSVMRDYFLEHYKLGEETGVDLPGEVHGLTDNLNGKQAVEFDTASFGQGIAVTPIEMARALAVLANGGKLVTPHVATAIKEESGITRQLGWGEPTQVLKQETVTTVTRMLTNVVDGPLANGAVKMDHWSIAAKTGTAQIANPAGGGYYTDRYLHSFFGYFPSYDAKFLVFLFAVEPQGAPFASQTWAPPFTSLTHFLINYYNIPPDR